MRTTAAVISKIMIWARILEFDYGIEANEFENGWKFILDGAENTSNPLKISNNYAIQWKVLVWTGQANQYWKTLMQYKLSQKMFLVLAWKKY